MRGKPVKTKTGRNEYCPSGQPVKFKKCLLAHPELRPNASRAQVWWACSRWQAGLPPLAERLAAMPTGRGTSLAKLDLVMEEALERMPEEMEWNDFFHILRSLGHPDLTGVFRRVSARVPRSKESGVAFFYWSVAEYFEQEHPEMLAELARAFCRLDHLSYNVDTLNHVEEILLVAGETRQALDLLCHFQPILKQDQGLMPWVVPRTAAFIIALRAGLLRADPATEHQTTDRLADLMSAGLDMDLDRAMLEATAGILWRRRQEPSWNEADFEFLRRPRPKRNDWWDENDAKPEPRRSVRKRKPEFPELEVEPLWLATRFAAAESVAAGPQAAETALYTTERVLIALSEWTGRSDDGPRNLAKILAGKQLESFVASACYDIVGPDPYRSILLMRGLRVFGAFLHSRGHLGAKMWAQAQAELKRLEATAGRLKGRL